MKRSFCEREQEALELVRSGRWPESVDEEYRAHASTCADCRDLLEVASLIRIDHTEAVRAVHVPTSGVVWWRMQRRARQEAIRTTTRAVTLVQGISVAVGLVIALGILGAMSWSGSFLSDVKSLTLPATTIAQWGMPLMLALAAWLALAPVALYFAVSKE